MFRTESKTDFCRAFGILVRYVDITRSIKRCCKQIQTVTLHILATVEHIIDNHLPISDEQNCTTQRPINKLMHFIENILMESLKKHF